MSRASFLLTRAGWLTSASSVTATIAASIDRARRKSLQFAPKGPFDFARSFIGYPLTALRVRSWQSARQARLHDSVRGRRGAVVLCPRRPSFDSSSPFMPYTFLPTRHSHHILYPCIFITLLSSCAIAFDLISRKASREPSLFTHKEPTDDRLRPQCCPLPLLDPLGNLLPHLGLLGHPSVLLVEIGDPGRLVLPRDVAQRSEVVSDRILGKA